MRGLLRLSAESFRKDYRLLLEGSSPLTKSIEKTAEALRELTDEDAEALAAVLSKPAGDSLRSIVRLLRESAGKPIRATLALVGDRFWEQSLCNQTRSALMEAMRVPPSQPERPR